MSDDNLSLARRNFRSSLILLVIAVLTSASYLQGHRGCWCWAMERNGSSSTNSKPLILFYRRYVDDTFCVFETEHDALLFFDFINTRHPNIRFTMEKEVDHKLPFLDVFIHNHSLGPTTTVFRKKTFTGLLSYYFSFTALSYKIGLVRTLIDSRNLQNQQHLVGLSQ